MATPLGNLLIALTAKDAELVKINLDTSYCFEIMATDKEMYLLANLV